MYPLWRMLSRARMTLRLSGLQKQGMGRDKATGQGQNSVRLVNNPGRTIIGVGWCMRYTTRLSIYFSPIELESDLHL